MSETSEPLAINPDLIRKYAAGASDFGIAQLITLFDFQRRNMQRAEDLCRAAWDDNKKLREQLSGAPAKALVTQPMAETKQVTKQPPKPAPTKTHGEVFDLDL